jgi:orotate phosphoribosyltransferase
MQHTISDKNRLPLQSTKFRLSSTLGDCLLCYRPVDHGVARRIFEASHLTGEFRLRSGTLSSDYFDKYQFEADPEVLREIVVQLKELLPRQVDLLAGLELGGIPIVTLLSLITGVPALFVRKKAKEYGTCRLAEGGAVRTKRLVVVEDVVTSGGQIIESVCSLREQGGIIETAVCVIDRQAGGPVNLKKYGVDLRALFTFDDLRNAVADHTDR